jgi:Site-specific recombinase XerD
MGSIRKRGLTYRAEVYRKGIRDSATFPTRQEAVDWVVQREADLLDGIVPAGRHTTKQAIEHYLGMRDRSRSDKARLGAIAAQKWAADPVSTLTPETIAGWRDDRAKKVGPATIRREMTALRAVLEMARKELRWLTVNPIKDVSRPPKPPPRRRLITDAERDAMVAALDFDGQRVETIAHETAVAFLLALETAMRAGEILALTPTDIDYRRRVAVLHKSKSGPGRDVPLSKRAIELLRAMGSKRLLKINSKRTGRVFHVDSDSLDVTFRRARNAAGLSGFTFHDSRAAALTRLAKILQPLDLARMSGHSNLSELLTYYRESVEAIAVRLG